MELSFIAVPLGDDADAALLSARRVAYGEDAYTWALQQAALLRARRFEELDVADLADEIADVAGREYDKLESALMRVVQHLLKWDFQPERRSRSWVLSIEEHRSRIHDQLRDHPGLKSVLDRAVSRAYRIGRLEALKETDLPRAVLPETVPYSWEDMLQRTYLGPNVGQTRGNEPCLRLAKRVVSTPEPKDVASEVLPIAEERNHGAARQAIVAGLRSFNRDRIGPVERRPLTFTLRHGERIVGGVAAKPIWAGCSSTFSGSTPRTVVAVTPCA